MSCPCGTESSFEQCCGLYHGGEKAPTPEALMRSRYCAFVRGNIDYVAATHHPKTRDDVDMEGATAWSKDSEWQGLEVVSSSEDGDTGAVEFIARYRQEGHDISHHEQSTFRRIDGAWYYEDGKIVKPGPVVNESPKVGRNEPCPCGSGKKYKKCCG